MKSISLISGYLFLISAIIIFIIFILYLLYLSFIKKRSGDWQCYCTSFSSWFRTSDAVRNANELRELRGRSQENENNQNNQNNFFFLLEVSATLPKSHPNLFQLIHYIAYHE